MSFGSVWTVALESWVVAAFHSLLPVVDGKKRAVGRPVAVAAAVAVVVAVDSVMAVKDIPVGYYN
jgi:hypothetical protein